MTNELREKIKGFEKFLQARKFKTKPGLLFWETGLGLRISKVELAKCESEEELKSKLFEIVKRALELERIENV
jgi:hypothetical protein